MLEKSERPWGRYEVLQESATHKVKCIWVNPGKRLSYQRHQKRAEHWFIVAGDAEVTINGVIKRVDQEIPWILELVYSIAYIMLEQLTSSL